MIKQSTGITKILSFLYIRATWNVCVSCGSTYLELWAVVPASSINLHGGGFCLLSFSQHLQDIHFNSHRHTHCMYMHHLVSFETIYFHWSVRIKWKVIQTGWLCRIKTSPFVLGCMRASEFASPVSLFFSKASLSAGISVGSEVSLDEDTFLLLEPLRLSSGCAGFSSI